LKILFISPRYSGGIGGHAAMLAAQLRQHGFQVDFMDPPKIPIKNLKNPSFVITSSLSSFFKGSYDIAHAFNVPSAFAMRTTRAKKRVLSIHGVFSDQINALHSSMLGNVAEITEGRVLKWADKLTTDSKMSQKIYKEKLGLDFVYLPSPIDTSKFADIADVEKKENQIIYIGRDSYEKGIDILRKIEPKINGNIVYCTDLPWKDAMTALKASSLIVVPSRMESLPTVIKEAFYLKVPVVATNVGGIAELIIDKTNGILVPPNDPQELLSAINLLLENREMAKKLTEAAFDYVTKNMTWDVILPKYIEFYENLKLERKESLQTLF
jgi:glycosyltransferase involved in cell wall biosynthesis